MLLSRAGAELTKSVTHLGSVVDRVHGGDVGEQRLRRADVAGRLVPPDVLLPRLQRQPETVVTLPQIFLAALFKYFYTPHSTSTSLVTPIILPGMCRTYAAFVAKKPAWGPP